MRSLLLIVLICAACAQTPPAATPGVVWLAMPGPRAASPTPAAPATPVIIASATPAPTPVTHIVAQGETLIGLAVRYGVSLEALQQANPGVQPEALSIGAVLIIPLASDAPAAAAGAQPTPMPVVFGPPACQPLANGALYCFVEARNPGAEPLEAVTARVTLAGADGLPLAEAVARPALDLLRAGAAIPLVAFLAEAPAGVAAVGVTAASAFPLSASAGRYLALEVTVGQVQLGRPLAVAAGAVRNPSSDTAATVRLAMAVYDEAGAVTGCTWLRLATPLAPGEARPFEMSAPVIGAAAADYRIWAEGRP